LQCNRYAQRVDRGVNIYPRCLEIVNIIRKKSFKFAVLYFTSFTALFTNNFSDSPFHLMNLFGKLFTLIKYSFILLGALLIISIIIAFTTAPFWGIYWLGTSKCKAVTPDKIVILGGGGMPSESNLMRLWYAIETSRLYPNAKIILAIPGDTLDASSAICIMADYAELQGIAGDRILFEPDGGNTRVQALNIFNKYYSATDSILLVTSPEHLRRAVLAFEKAGFDKLGGQPAFPVALEGNLIFSSAQAGKAVAGIPEIGDNLQIRYQFWNHLIFEIVLMREYCALMYYKINVWI